MIDPCGRDCMGRSELFELLSRSDVPGSRIAKQDIRTAEVMVVRLFAPEARKEVTPWAEFEGTITFAGHRSMCRNHCTGVLRPEAASAPAKRR
jgi:hypothetical protein